MKTCMGCHAINPLANVVCKSCGQALPAPATASGETVRWTGPLPAPSRQGPGARISLKDLFAAKSRLVVGRGADCDICLPHPLVSRYHLLIEHYEGGVRLRDLGSINGVWVGGVRIGESATIAQGDRVGVGPFLFTLRDGVIHSVDSSRSLRLEARGLEKLVPIAGAGPRKLLDNINLVVNPGEFVTLLGPSGSGKSTLMDCLNGRRRATGGLVLANGEDFYRHFDNFRQSLGYVPQKDIVHAQLTVERALYYTARLRLPTDTATSELEGRIEAVVDEMELKPHRDTMIANLSGGQIKRVSLGAELLAQPCLLFIDEATSGLDAGTEARMMRLFRGLADEGRSIICITHNVDNVEQCHLVLVLAGGKLVYYGPPGEAPAYFGVARVSEVYDRLADKDIATWEQLYKVSSLYKEYVAQRLAGPPAPPPPPLPMPVRATSQPAAAEPPPTKPLVPGLAEGVRALSAQALRLREWLNPVQLAWHQFRVLTRRYLDLTLGDRKGLRLLILQAPLVAVFLLVGFLDKKFNDTVPVPRQLTDEERKLLHALEAVAGIIQNKDNPDPDQTKALQKIKLEVAMESGQVTTVDGVQLMRILRGLNKLPADDNALDTARLTFADDDKNSLTARDLTRVFQRIQETNLISRIRNYKGPLVPDSDIVNPRYTYMLLFIMVVVVLGFGCNNAAKEIVKEEAIYGRERAVNLGILPYLGSKFLVLSLITMFHALLLMTVLHGTMSLLHLFDPEQFSLPSLTYMLGYPAQLGVLCLLSMTGVALGLVLSACVATPDRANALLPYVLIPQLILGGGFLGVGSGLLYWLAMILSPVYWAYRAIHLGAGTLPEYYPGHVNYPDNPWVPCAALLIQTAALLLGTAWCLKHKDAK